MVKQGVDQSSVTIARGRMDNQSSRFVDNQQMLVLKHDLQRNVLWFVMCRLRLWNRNSHGFLAANLCRRIAQRLAIGFYGAAANKCLEPLSREGRDRCCKRPIEPPSRMDDLKPHIDRPNSPHPKLDMGIVPLVFNIAALAQAETLPH